MACRMLPCSEQGKGSDTGGDKGAPTQGTVGTVPRNGTNRSPMRYLLTLSGSSCGRRSAVVAVDFAYGQSEVALGWERSPRTWRAREPEGVPLTISSWLKLATLDVDVQRLWASLVQLCQETHDTTKLAELSLFVGPDTEDACTCGTCETS